MLLENVLPQNIEAERAVIGNILFDQESIYKVMDIIKPDDFYSPAHRIIYSVILELNKKSSPIDVITVAEQLKNTGRTESAGGEAYFTSLIDLAPITTNIATYANIVKESSIRRELITNSMEIAKMGYDLSMDVNSYIESAVKGIFDIAQKRFTSTMTSVRDLIDETYEKIEERRKNKKAITGVPTGFDALDQITSGLQPSDLIVVAARPGVGKTSFALNIALNAAIKITKIPVAVFSLEMSKFQLALRLLSMEAKVSYMSILKGYLEFSDFQRLNKAASLLKESLITVDDKPAISMLEIRAKARRLQAEHKLGLLIIDYLQIMEYPKDTENTQAAIASLSGSLKALAKELNIPVLLISQLNREGERDSRKPQLSDLRGSGAIEQDADLIMFIHRPELYSKEENPKEQGIAEILIAKHRNGPTRNIKLSFIRDFTRFENYTSEKVVVSGS